MAQNVNLKTLLVKLQSAQGTPATPAAATDGLEVMECSYKPELKFTEYKKIRAALGNYEQVLASSRGTLKIVVAVAGFATKGSPPPALDALLRMCSMAVTNVASTSSTYTLISSADPDTAPCGTVLFNQSGVLHQVTDARGTVAVDMSDGNIATFTFNLFGIDAALTDQAMPSPVFSGYNSPLVVNDANVTSLTVHGFASAALTKLSTDVANTVSHVTRINRDNRHLITNRTPKGSLQIEMTSVAAKDWYGTVKSGTAGNIVIAHGPAGNRFTLTARAQLTDFDDSNSDNDIVMLDTTLTLVPSSALNDELSFKFD